MTLDETRTLIDRIPCILNHPTIQVITKEKQRNSKKKHMAKLGSRGSK